MRIDNTTPYLNFDTGQTVVGKNASAGGSAAAGANGSELPRLQNTGYYGSGVIVEISQAARDYGAQNNFGSLEIGASKKGTPELSTLEKIQKIKEAQSLEGCQTCKNRKYVDGSDDPSVSFQTPQHISPQMAGAKVMAHEREHVTNEQEKAQREDRKVISQTVSLSTGICPECGKMYISGGVTRTVTASDKKAEAENGNAAGESTAKHA